MEGNEFIILSVHTQLNPTKGCISERIHKRHDTSALSALYSGYKDKEKTTTTTIHG